MRQIAATGHRQINLGQPLRTRRLPRRSGRSLRGLVGGKQVLLVLRRLRMPPAGTQIRGGSGGATGTERTGPAIRLAEICPSASQLCRSQRRTGHPGRSRTGGLLPSWHRRLHPAGRSRREHVRAVRCDADNRRRARLSGGLISDSDHRAAGDSPERGHRGLPGVRPRIWTAENKEQWLANGKALD